MTGDPDCIAQFYARRNASAHLLVSSNQRRPFWLLHQPWKEGLCHTLWVGSVGRNREMSVGDVEGCSWGGVEKGWEGRWDGTRDRWLTEDGLYIINKKDVWVKTRAGLTHKNVSRDGGFGRCCLRHPRHGVFSCLHFLLIWGRISTFCCISVIVETFFFF